MSCVKKISNGSCWRLDVYDICTYTPYIGRIVMSGYLRSIRDAARERLWESSVMLLVVRLNYASARLNPALSDRSLFLISDPFSGTEAHDDSGSILALRCGAAARLAAPRPRLVPVISACPGDSSRSVGSGVLLMFGFQPPGRPRFMADGPT